MSINRDILLRCIIGVHFVYTSMVNMAEWLPFSYNFNQIAILVLGFWAISNRESAVQIELLMIMEAFSLFLDSLAIGMYFQIGKRAYHAIDHSSYFGLSAFFAIFLLILKPLMLVVLYKVRQHRLGDRSSPAFGEWGAQAGAAVPGYTPVGGESST